VTHNGSPVPYIGLRVLYGVRRETGKE